MCLADNSVMLTRVTCTGMQSGGRYDSSRSPPLVGARRHHPRRTGRHPRRDRAHRGPADAGRRLESVGVAAAVVRHGLHAGARGGHAPGRSPGRSVWTQGRHGRRARPVRVRLRWMRVCAEPGGVHRRPGRGRAGRGGPHRRGALRHHRAVRRGGAATGGGNLGRGQLHRPAPGSHHRGLDAHATSGGAGSSS